MESRGYPFGQPSSVRVSVSTISSVARISCSRNCSIVVSGGASLSWDPKLNRSRKVAIQRLKSSVVIVSTRDIRFFWNLAASGSYSEAKVTPGR